jgi:hypothetical protein
MMKLPAALRFDKDYRADGNGDSMYAKQFLRAGDCARNANAHAALIMRAPFIPLILRSRAKHGVSKDEATGVAPRNARDSSRLQSELLSLRATTLSRDVRPRWHR